MNHLFLLIHGLWGNPKHMSAVKEVLDDIHGVKVGGDIITYSIKSNTGTLSYDGVVICSRRTYLELKVIINLYKKKSILFDRISIIGYSFGGLIARHLVGILYEEKFFTKIQPLLFVTIATPHIGVSFYTNNLLFQWINTVGGIYLGNTGRDLFLKDPTLLQMANPKFAFYKGLAEFKHKILLANIHNDRTVRFPTAFISAVDPFSNLDFLRMHFHHIKLQEPVIDRLGLSHNPRIVDLKRTKRLPFPLPLNHEYIRQKLIFWTLAATAGPLIITIGLIISMFITKISNSRIQNFINNGDDVFIDKILAKVEEEFLEKDENISYEDDLTKSDDSENLSTKAHNNIEASNQNTQSDCCKNILPSSNVEGLDELINASRDINNDLLEQWPDKVIHSTEVLNMIEKLNLLNWEKYPVYISVIHSHAAIVARLGLKTQGQGAATLRLFSEIVRSKL